MIGYQDTCNCNFGKGGINTRICYYSSFNANNGTCDDNDLDNSCPAMLQGSYRYLRMINWMKYLKYYYGADYSKHRLVYANVGHDYTGMMTSPQGQCMLYGFRCDQPGVLDAVSTTPGIYLEDDFKVGL